MTQEMQTNRVGLHARPKVSVPLKDYSDEIPAELTRQLEGRDATAHNTPCLRFPAVSTGNKTGVSRGTMEPDLKRVVDAWDTLPQSVRKAILLIVNNSSSPERYAKVS